eukprot:g2155.t1
MYSFLNSSIIALFLLQSVIKAQKPDTVIKDEGERKDVELINSKESPNVATSTIDSSAGIGTLDAPSVSLLDPHHIISSLTTLLDDHHTTVLEKEQEKRVDKLLKEVKNLEKKLHEANRKLDNALLATSTSLNRAITTPENYFKNDDNVEKSKAKENTTKIDYEERDDLQKSLDANRDAQKAASNVTNLEALLHQKQFQLHLEQGVLTSKQSYEVKDCRKRMFQARQWATRAKFEMKHRQVLVKNAQYFFSKLVKKEKRHQANLLHRDSKGTMMDEKKKKDTSDILTEHTRSHRRTTKKNMIDTTTLEPSPPQTLGPPSSTLKSSPSKVQPSDMMGLNSSDMMVLKSSDDTMELNSSDTIGDVQLTLLKLEVYGQAINRLHETLYLRENDLYDAMELFYTAKEALAAFRNQCREIAVSHNVTLLPMEKEDYCDPLFDIHLFPCHARLAKEDRARLGNEKNISITFMTRGDSSADSPANSAAGSPIDGYHGNGYGGNTALGKQQRNELTLKLRAAGIGQSVEDVINSLQQAFQPRTVIHDTGKEDMKETDAVKLLASLL